MRTTWIKWMAVPLALGGCNLAGKTIGNLPGEEEAAPESESSGRASDAGSSGEASNSASSATDDGEDGGTTFAGESTGESGGTTSSDDEPIGPGDCGAVWPSEVIEADLGELHLGHQTLIGPDGSLHAAYNTNIAAHHAERVDGAWVVSTFPTVGTVWAKAAAIGEDGVVHLLWRDNADDMLRYQRRIDGAWVGETADLGGCGAASVAIGGDGTLHVAGHRGHNLCYATRSPAGQWAVELVGAAFRRGAALVLDASETVHIAYYGPTLHYARGTAGAWTLEEIGSGGIDATMVLDPGGVLHIGHSESPNGTVQLAYGSSGAWTTEMLAPSAADLHTSAPGVAVDAAGALHLVHPDPSDERCLIRRSRDIPEDPWTIDVVANDNYALAAIALDADAAPHVVYATPDGSLRYASPAL